MCNFFSVTSDGKGNIKYFNWEQRKKILNGEEGYKGYNPDSHTSINDFYGYKGEDEDIRNKYEYNPLTKVFIIDQINSIDDSEIVEEKVRALDFEDIVEPLIVKPIIHPFKDIPKVNKVEEKHLALLREWVSVENSVENSVRDSVRVSVGDSVRDFVWNSVENSVENSVGTFVRASVGESVENSVRASVYVSVWNSVYVSVWNSVYVSVWDSVYAYVSSFFTIKKWKYIDHEPYINPFQPVIDLWEMGIVPSYDGYAWRLHSGENADVIWKGTV